VRATTELEESRMKDIHEIVPGMTNAANRSRTWLPRVSPRRSTSNA
jgi:hypothetical protein